MFFFVFGIARCTDYSMYPSIKDGDLAIYYRLEHKFQAGDAVVVRKNNRTEIRRIIAVPGDKVDITKDGLKINGYLQQENNIREQTLPYVDGIKFPIKLLQGEYFVLGDSRSNTRDSRLYGPVNEDEIKGIVMTLIRKRGI